MTRLKENRMNKLYNPDLAALILRIAFGGLMLLNHGWPKFNKIIDGNLGFADPLGLGPELSLYLIVFAELICGGLILVGMFTRWATIPLIIGMGVAFFVQHGGEPIADREAPLVFLLGYLAILLLGPGKYSFDRAFRKKV